MRSRVQDLERENAWLRAESVAAIEARAAAQEAKERVQLQQQAIRWLRGRVRHLEAELAQAVEVARWRQE